MHVPSTRTAAHLILLALKGDLRICGWQQGGEVGVGVSEGMGVGAAVDVGVGGRSHSCVRRRRDSSSRNMPISHGEI